MTWRLGTDLIAVATVQDALDTHGDRYLQRVYTPAEVADCRTRDGGIDAERLAARFAAKEAVIKVLRPNDEALPWQTIEVVKHAAGWVGVALKGVAAEIAARAGVHELALSVSHESGFASAVAAAEVSDTRGTTE